MNLRRGMWRFFTLKSYILPDIPILGVLMNSFLVTSLADNDLDSNCTYVVVALSSASRCDTRAL
jgi:hypothetical protein